MRSLRRRVQLAAMLRRCKSATWWHLREGEGDNRLRTREEETTGYEPLNIEGERDNMLRVLRDCEGCKGSRLRRCKSATWWHLREGERETMRLRYGVSHSRDINTGSM